MLNAHQWMPRRPLPHGCDIQYPLYHGHDAPMPTNGRHDGYGLPVPSYGCDSLMPTNGCHDPPIPRARRPMPTNGRHNGYSLFPSYGRDARCLPYYGCDTPMPTKTVTLDARATPRRPLHPNATILSILVLVYLFMYLCIVVNEIRGGLYGTFQIIQTWSEQRSIGPQF
jgi:hypothetical protein